MVIRKETTREFSQIYELVRVAFQTAKVSNGKEQDFVNDLRGGSNYIPDLALVAEENGKLLGHIMFTRNYIGNGDNKFETLLLAPISVVLESRNKGIASALIKEGFKLAREMGYKSVVLVGDPAFYHRSGFRTAADFGVKHSQEIPDANVMACELVRHALHGVNGTTDCC